ncbi:hypothetical protein MESS2_750006 [Mesorhizobium metallidurans STM 2683]|uniref:Uncharacterized protein n=1 Tax=Mesorhizobium metallidurans STM 2683 TaxID=1297569 RepID=M5EW36_9HYPH|nr:hypothetical protein [Mesorhizobium metallidurans]CCV08457.1 hypothetical protein MESS2_750006 [Mesorhizobium metallidurans STM 2683]
METLAGAAVPIAQICEMLDIPKSTLYRPELRRGAAWIESLLVGHLLRLAGGNDRVALKAIAFAFREPVWVERIRATAVAGT